jgi:adenylate cyclase
MMAESGSRVAITLYLTWLAEARMLAGSIGAAWQAINEAFSANLQEKVFCSESLRVRATLHAMDGETERGVEDLQSAIDLARSMEAKSFELRALVSLCRLRMSGAALSRLKALVDALPEESDVRDVQDAHAVVLEK